MRPALFSLAVILASPTLAGAADKPFEGDVFAVDCDRGNESCQISTFDANDANSDMQTNDPRLVSVALTALETRYRVVKGTYRDAGDEKQLVSIECSREWEPEAPEDVVYRIRYSETDKFAQVWISGYETPLKVAAANLQAICESSFSSGKKLEEISVKDGELKRAKLRVDRPVQLKRKSKFGQPR